MNQEKKLNSDTTRYKKNNTVIIVNTVEQIKHKIRFTDFTLKVKNSFKWKEANVFCMNFKTENQIS